MTDKKTAFFAYRRKWKRCFPGASLPATWIGFRIAEHIKLMILLDENGAARGIRTPDPLITNEVLYRLSYCGDLGRTSPGRSP
jgi:hypothetical protein